MGAMTPARKRAEARARTQLSAIGVKVQKAADHADKMRRRRNEVIVSVSDVLTPREIAGIDGMPTEAFIRRVLRDATTTRRNDADH